MRTVRQARIELPDLGSRGEGWVGIQTALIVAVLAAAGLTGGGWDGSARTVTSVAGLALCVIGIAMFALGARELGSRFSIWMTPTGDRVVDSGIYGWVRHPICGGQVLIGFGVGLVGASWLALVLALTYAGLVWLKSRHEETMIERRLPAYAAYRRRVPRAMIPGLV